MENPISSKDRGRLYVAGIVIGALATVFGPLSAALGLSDEWSSVVTSVVGALILITNTLSKANLTADTATATVSTDTLVAGGSTVSSEAIDVTAALSEVDSQIQAEEAPVGDVDDPTGALTDSE
jgi:uncharacterized membrane protein YraQ (UPF0718 family)